MQHVGVEIAGTWVLLKCQGLSSICHTLLVGVHKDVACRRALLPKETQTLWPVLPEYSNKVSSGWICCEKVSWNSLITWLILDYELCRTFRAGSFIQSPEAWRWTGLGGAEEGNTSRCPCAAPEGESGWPGCTTNWVWSIVLHCIVPDPGRSWQVLTDPRRSW